MSYVCVRPITLNGQDYLPGEHIAAEDILPGREKALESSGRIAKVGTSQNVPAREGIVILAVPVTGTDGEQLELTMDAEAVIDTIRIMQLNADNAVEAVKDVTNEDILILLHNTDSRQSVKKAARTQADKLATLQAAAMEDKG